MKINFPNKEQAKEAFENAMQNATVYWWDKKPDKLISVTPQCAEDEERAQAMEKILNEMFSKLMKVKGFKEDFIDCTLKQTPFQFVKYLDKILNPLLIEVIIKYMPKLIKLTQINIQ